jgi:hypothetical protein
MRKTCKASLVRLAATPTKIKTMPRATKPNITDFGIGFFVGILSKKRSKPKPESAGYKESNDLRDLDAIRDWTRDVAKMINS